MVTNVNRAVTGCGGTETRFSKELHHASEGCISSNYPHGLRIMKNIASFGFRLAVIVSALLLAVAALVTVALQLAPPPADRLPLLNFELDIFKTILAGFVVGMLGILIPAVASETRYRFKQRKESRIAYSKAKTAVDYLKLRLSVSNLAEATAALQQAHFRKHVAELFDDFGEWLIKRYGKTMNADQWDKMMYGRLFSARQIVEENAEQWDQLSPEKRIQLLNNALPTKSEIDEQRRTMHTVMWTFKIASDTPKAELVATIKATAHTYQGIPGLIRKCYGIAPDGSSVVGIYLWEDEAAAKAFYTPDWETKVTKRWGAAPQPQNWETPMVVESAERRLIAAE